MNLKFSVVNALFVVSAVLVMAVLLYMFMPYHSVTVMWSNTFGGEFNDSGAFVLPLEQGCIVVGETEVQESRGKDVMVMKIGENGSEIWHHIYGGERDDYGKAAYVTENGYLIVGGTYSFGKGESDVWLIKIDSNGNEIWNHTFGASGWEFGNSIEKSRDGKYLITGYTTSYGNGKGDLWLVKVDSNGNEIWNHTFGGAEYDEGRYLVEADAGYIIAGRTSSYGTGGSDAWLVNVDEEGNEIWNITFGTENDDLFNEVISTDDGFVAVGHTLIEKPEHWAGLAVKVSENGTELWSTVISSKEACGISSVDLCCDGYILVGYIGKSENYQDNLMVKLDSNGNTVWKESFGSNYGDAGVWIKKYRNNEFLITGYRYVKEQKSYDIWLLRVSVA